MERVFKHKETKEIAYYKDGIFKRGKTCLDIGHEPSNEFWEEVIISAKNNERKRI